MAEFFKMGDSIKDAIISPPTIFNERVYISTKDTTFCYNLYSGIREKDINLIEKMGVGKKLVKYNDKKYYEDMLYFVDPSFFTIFSFPLVRGQLNEILVNKHVWNQN